VAVRICEPQCITSLSGCLRVQFRMSTAPVYDMAANPAIFRYCFVYIHVSKTIAFVNFQDERDILFIY